MDPLSNYVAMKEKIFANQTGENYLILNGDDPVAQQAASRTRSQVLWFSRSKIVRYGAFLLDGMVMFRPTEQAKPTRYYRSARHSTQGRAQHRKHTRRGLRRLCGENSHPDDCPGSRRFPAP